MTNKIPIIKIKSEIKKTVNTNPYIRDVVALIGGFETTEKTNEPTFVSGIDEARELFGTDTTFDGNKALEQILKDDEISGVIVVNVSTQSGDTIQSNITSTKLNDAITSLDLINFNLLYVAAELTDAFITSIDTFAASRFENKSPFGYVSAFQRTTNVLYETSAGKLGDWCYASVLQKLEVNNDDLDLIETGAYITRLIALSNVGDSLTARQLSEVTGIATADVKTFNDGDDGAVLTGYGYLLFRLIDASENIYECVNSANPNGLDLYISRVRDYIVDEFNLRQFLGQRNNNVTLDAISMECNDIYTKFMDLGLIESMSYTVEKAGTDKVNVIINSIEFAGVIVEVDMFITIEVV